MQFMANKKTALKRAFLSGILLLVLPCLVLAGDVMVPHIFTGGARAEQLNENFAALATAINDNGAVIHRLQRRSRPVVIDDFDRADSATVGNDWQEPFGEPEIVNGEARIPGHNGAGPGGTANQDPFINRIFSFQGNFEVQVKVRFDSVDVRPILALNGPETRVSGPTLDLGINVAIIPDASQVILRSDSLTPLATASMTTFPNTDYKVRLRYQFGQLSAKVWLASDPEPTDPTVTAPATTPLGQYLLLGANIAGTQFKTVFFDDLIARP